MGRLRTALLALMASMAPVFAQQAPSTVTNMPFASTPLSGSELLYLVQNGNPRKTTVGSLSFSAINNLLTMPQTVRGNWTFTVPITVAVPQALTTPLDVTSGGTGNATGSLSALMATPARGSLASTLSTILGRIVSIDDALGIHANGLTDDTPTAQTLLNAVGASGGGTVLVGPHQYALNPAIIAGQQPTAALFNTSGFTLLIPNANTLFQAGSAITLTGFAAPLAQLNGTWSVSSAGSSSLVVLTALTGTQTQTSTGLGSLYSVLSIPSNVKLVCPKALSGIPPSGMTYGQLPYTFLTSGFGTVSPQRNAGFYGCNVVNAAVANSIISTTTIRQNINVQQAFLGTGVYVGSSDVELQDLLIVGHSVGVNSQGGARGRWSHLNIDATQCTNTNNSHDISHYLDLHCFPFATGGANQFASGAITGVANNGAGLWRVSTSFASQVVVGDTVYVAATVGAGSANNTWTVAATDGATYIDLAASNSAGTSTYTGATTNTSYCLEGMTGTAGIGVGDNISGTNIPAASTVTAVIPRQNAVCISNKMTATAAGVAITTTPIAYSTGGNVYLDASKRSGYGHSWTDGEANVCVDCFSYDHETGFYIGALASWTTLTNIKVDNYISEHDVNSVCIQIDGSSVGTLISGGSTQSCAVPLLGTSTNANQAHIITGMVLNGLDRRLELATGRYEIGLNSGNSLPNFVGDNVGYLGYNMNDFGASWQFATSNGQTAVEPFGNSFSGSNVFQGQFYLYGIVSMGGNGTRCGQFNTCVVSTTGPTVDATVNVSACSSTPQSGNAGSVACSNTTTAPATFPSIAANGQKFSFLFQNAVTVTWASGSGTVGAACPASVLAGQMVSAEAYGGVWYCR